MRMFQWRVVAYGLAAASLCVTVAACDDDSGGGDMGMDMGVKMDMTTGDMAAPTGDMTMASLPNAQVVVADIIGTVYTEAADGGIGGTLPGTHILEAVTDFPSASSTDTFSNFMANAATLSISGCVANRYDYSTTTGHQAAPDVNVGTVTLSGWEGGATAFRFAASPLAPAAQNGFFAPSLPTSADCTIPSGKPFYACAFSGTPDNQTPKGIPVSAVLFPTVTTAQWTGLCQAFLTPLGAAAVAACTAACDTSLGAGTCTQPLLAPTMGTGDAMTGSTVTINTPGAAPYNAASKTLNVPVPVTIVDIKVGGTSVVVTHTLEDLTGKVNPASPKDIDISYSCDGSATTAGSGCATLGPFELVSVVAQTSLGAKQAFASTTSPQFGTLSCIEQAKRTDATIHIPAAAITALLGGANGGTAQTTGSVNFTLIRLSAALQQLNPNQLYSAGLGQFAFIDL